MKLKGNIKKDLPYNTSPKREIGSIESFCKAKDGNIWIATTVGLCKLDPSNKNLNFYQPTPSSKDIIANHLNSLQKMRMEIYGLVPFSGF